MSSARARLPGTMSELEDIRQQLHVTQSNHTQRLTRIEDRLGRVDEALGRVETDSAESWTRSSRCWIASCRPRPGWHNPPERGARGQLTTAVLAPGFQTGSPR
jgi:hypothetical protein